MNLFQSINYRAVFVLILAAHLSPAQVSFQEQVAPPPSPQITFDFNQYNGQGKAIDIDGDQDVDLFFYDGIGCGTRSLHLNDGKGNFRATASPFFFSMFNVQLADLDGDNDLDVLTFSKNNGANFGARIFRQTGTAVFTPDTQSLPPVLGTGAFGDVDNDGDLDLIITGDTMVNPSLGARPITHLYKNDGSGNFQLFDDTTFRTLDAEDRIQFVDYDQDGDQDLLFTEVSQGLGSVRQFHFYANDGQGQYQLKSNLKFFDTLSSFENKKLIIKDLDGNGNLEYVMSGSIFNFPNPSIRGIFITQYNNGSFSPAQKIDPPAPVSFTVRYNQLAAIDYQDDGDYDLVSLRGFKTVLENNGSNTFKHDSSSFLPFISFPNFNFRSPIDAFLYQDFTGDGNSDLIVSPGVTYLVDSSGRQQFTKVEKPFMKGMNNGTLIWKDINGDSLVDILINGSVSNGGDGFTQYHFNRGNGVYLSAPDGRLAPMAEGAMAAHDIDNDGDEDIVINGDELPGVMEKPKTIIYKNNGAGNFSIYNDSTLPGLMNGSIAFIDLNGNGTQELFLTGTDSLSNFRAQFYLNDGNGNFTPDGTHGLKPFINGKLLKIDIENDGDLDVLLTGDSSGFNTPATWLYRNDGQGNFSRMSEPFEFLSESDALAIDIDNDQNKDLIIAGRDKNRVEFTGVYRNDGAGNFTQDKRSNLKGISAGQLAKADWNGDSIMDILLSGSGSTTLYQNDGTGLFTELNLSSSLPKVTNSSAVTTDANQDGMPDLLIAGLDMPNCLTQTRYFINNTRNFSLPEKSRTASLKIFPNPVTHKATIVLPQLHQEINLKIFNTLGTLVEEYQFHGTQKFNLPLHLINSGIYILDINGDQEYSYQTKVVVP